MDHKPRTATALVGLGLFAVLITALLADQRGTGGSMLPHGYCFTWNPALVWTHVISDSLIGAAYVSIPFTLMHLVRKRGDLPFDGVVWLFALFIISCGASHMVEVWTVWNPDYWLSAVVKTVTAAASVLTAIVLIRLVPRLLAVPSTAGMRSAKESLEAEVARRIEVEAELLRERAELEQRVQQRTQELQLMSAQAQEAREEAEEANRTKDLFLAKVSHELRTPLQASLSWAQIVQRVADDPVRVASAADRIVANVKAQARMIDDLLDLSRVLSGKLGLNPAPVRIGEVLRSAIEVVQSVHPGRSLDVQIDCEDVVVQADAQRLEQVIWNLVNNALQATPDQGVVRVSCTSTDRAVQIEVQDSGIGIGTDQLARIFEPFRQVSRGSHGGLGLGLAISRSIIDRSGGTLEAHSKGLGLGATFSVCLPRPNTPIEPSAGEAPLAEADIALLRGLHLLCVEDKADIAQGLRAVLSAAGLQVELCADTQAARAALAQREFDFLLCDLDLDHHGGAIALLQGVRADDRHRGMVAIVLSAHGGAEVRQASAVAGFADHLVKPVEVDRLLRTLLAWVRERGEKKRV